MKNFSLKPLNIILNKKPIEKLMKKINPDILHVHYAGVNGVIGGLSGFHPLLLTAWGSDILIATKSIIVKPLVKFVLNRADLITCDAEHMKEAMIKLGVNPSKIKIINFGIDTQKFCPGPKNENLMENLGISDYQIVISLRSLEPVYNVETLIKATPFVLKEVPKTYFIIAGKGSQAKELKKITDDLGIRDNIKFIGWVSNKELPDYLRASDIYVSTSLSDGGIASSTAEAMACELPVIITDTADNKKWIEDGENGFIVPTKNPEFLAKKIIYLLKNEDVRKKIGEQGRKTIKERNDYRVEMSKMEEIYKELAKK
jgi:glycosyltransferase involved in cell wall biosynthesis